MKWKREDQDFRVLYPLGKDKFEAFTVCDYCWTEVRAEGSPEGGESSPELEALSFRNAHFDCADKIMDEWTEYSSDTAQYKKRLAAYRSECQKREEALREADGAPPLDRSGINPKLTLS